MGTPTRSESFLRIPAVILAITAGFLLVVSIGFALFATRFKVVSVVSDDAYYYLQIAKNLARTGQSTFDGITRTSGYHPLFATVLAGIYRAFSPGQDLFVHVMLVLNVVMHFMTGGVLFLVGRRLRDKLTGVIAALLYLANPFAAIWTLTGMEAALNGLCVAFFLLTIVPPAQESDAAAEFSFLRLLAIGLAAAACVFARTDNFIVVGLLALATVANPGTSFRNRVIAAIVMVFAAGIALADWLLFCHHATGDWVQGSARLKMLLREYKTFEMNPIQWLMYSFGVFQKFVVKSFVKTPALKYLLIFGLFTGWRLFKDRVRNRTFVLYLLAIPLILGAAYGVKLTRAATWYYVPPVIVLTVFSAFFARSLLTNTSARVRTGVLIATVLISIEACGYYAGKVFRGRNGYQRDMLNLTAWMHNNLPPDAVLGAWDAGIYSYYSGRKVINLDGLMNNDIAEMMEANRASWPEWKSKGIDSVDTYELWYAGDTDQYWRYWRDRDIQYIVGSTRWLRGIPETWQGNQLVLLHGPLAQYSSSPKALYEIRWVNDEL